jgi:hypothetical protein
LTARACRLVPKATPGRVLDAVGVYGAEWVSRALDRVAQRNGEPGKVPVRSWGFVLSTLGNWKSVDGPPPADPPSVPKPEPPRRPKPEPAPEAGCVLPPGGWRALVAEIAAQPSPAPPAPGGAPAAPRFEERPRCEQTEAGPGVPASGSTA